MAALTPQNIVPTKLAPTYSAASSGGDTIADDGTQRTVARVKNASGGSITVTVVAQTTTKVVKGYRTVTVANATISVPAGGDRIIGPFPDCYRDAAGTVSLTYSATASVTVAALKLPRLD
jgi:hypothetical protein